MEILSMVNFALDITLIIMSFWMLTLVMGYGGAIGRAFNMVGIGAVILGFAHLTETIILKVFGFGHGTVEFSHRFLVFIGFSLMIIGFRMFIKNK